MSAMAQVGVFDDPLSSSEDELPKPSSKDTTQSTAKRRDPARATTESKLTAQKEGAPRPTKRRRTNADMKTNTDVTEGIQEVNNSVEDDLNFLRPSQSSQNRSSQKYLSQTSQTRKFKPIAEPVVTPERKKKPMKLDAVLEPSASPPSTRRRKHSRLSNPIPPALDHEAPQSSLNIPHLDDDDVNDIASSIDTTRDSTFSRPLDAGKSRRGSTSSLSSTDSVIEQLVPDKTRMRLMDDATNAIAEQQEVIPRTHFKCPICSRVTAYAGLKGVIGMAELTFNAQQKLCREHRMRDAKKLSKEMGYPSVDWAEIKSSARLARQLKNLTKIIQRKKESYYLQCLDDAIKDAQGQQKQINLYFDVRLLDVVHQGYFGPKGAKLFSEIIAQDQVLQKLLSRQIRSDKAIRTAGVGRFVQAVLLPELTTNLLMDEMGIVDAQAGRKAMQDSQEAGVLLQPDDDQVDVRRADDDDDNVW